MTFAAFTPTGPEPLGNAPDRIYNWLSTQLSIARFCGGCTYQGHSYLIDMKGEGQPLVKQSVLMAEMKATEAAKNAEIPQEMSLF